MEITIRQAEGLPKQIELLAALAQQEGYQFIHWLIEEYQSGKNCFDQTGECLMLAYDQDQLVGCGGLNQQWGDTGVEDRIGRVRRFYVHPKYRQHGVGKQLLQALEKNARPFYSALCLNTEITGAVRFYQKNNYVYVESHPNYNYFKYLIA
ncbi:GNAT family N-acetyltransferase [Acinetobacter tianfuensis]|uniref:N-acetyltransferase n=1 Tax=Acinetobacter tianfuensis TaxID=2419603 RepID=A0A3A8EGH0_9GAMM|nr:GNAT family N-acetyltransferase [Acinetobacter tianfuensis]RKG34042.1 N-acetyltransferase [Acinetobacter tianfuensis]